MVLNDNRNQTTVSDFATYEDYLDSQITPTDLYYLEDKEMARQLVELGYRGSGEPLKREEFEARKKLLANTDSDETNKQTFDSAGTGTGEKNDRTNLFKDDPFLKALSEREEGNRIGKMMVYYNMGNKKSTDLSFYNWVTRTCTTNHSPNFSVVTDNEDGILFKSKKDRKILNVNPMGSGDSTQRTVVDSDDYFQVVLYDHITKRKA